MQIGCSGRIRTDMVENADKNRVGLSVYFLKLDGYQVYLTEYSCGEEIGSRIEAVQYIPFIVLYDRF